MASLMEELIGILGKENSEYELLLKLSREKTPIIIKGDIQQLQKITEEEQDVVSRINHLDRKREEVFHDIADVINKDVKTLKLKDLISMMKGQPQEQQKLAEVHDKLQTTVNAMKTANEQNRSLLEHSLEMVQFDLTLLQSLGKAPETADYNKGAYSAGNTMGAATGRFDAKQ